MNTLQFYFVLIIASAITVLAMPLTEASTALEPLLDINDDLSLIKRQSAPTSTSVEVCLVPGTSSTNGTSSQTLIDDSQQQFDPATNNTLGGGPWVPDCKKLNGTAAIAACLACQDIADATFVTAVVGCSEVSPFCFVAVEICEAACVAFASYSLYSAYQKCYCLHADCSNSAAVSSSNIQQTAPQSYINNAVFNVQLANGGGSVGPTADYDFSNNNTQTWNNMPACASSNIIFSSLGFGFALS